MNILCLGRAIAVSIMVLAPALVSAVDFSSPPVLSGKAGMLEVSFSITASTDVEVAVLNQSGKIIRHLAAGVLGGTYPPPLPLKPGLSQTLIWDYKDDYGNTAAGAPFSVRVRLGLKPVFERSISTKGHLPEDNPDHAYNYFPSGFMARGDFLETTHPVIQRMENHNAPPLLIGVSDETDRLYVKVFREEWETWQRLIEFNGITGQFARLLKLECQEAKYRRYGDLAVSWDGQNIYYQECQDGYLYRFNSNGQPDNWPGQSSYVFKPSCRWQAYQGPRGLATGPDNTFYNLHTRCADDGYQFSVSTVKNGSVDRSRFINIDASATGVRVDLKGNVFVAARIKPVNEPIPSDVAGQISGSISTSHSQAWWAEELYGSLIKFPPSGGSASQSGSGTYHGGYWPDDKVNVSGAEWVYYGYSHVLSKGTWKTGCICQVSRFDVDRYGRVFMPNTMNYQVVMLDNNRNEILRLKYLDIVVAGKVPVGLIHQVEVTDRAMYMADYYNNHVIAMTLAGEVEKTVSLSSNIEVEYRMSNVECRNPDVRIYNLQGKLVGKHAFSSELPNGLYIYRIKTGNRTVYRKVILMR